MAMVVAVEGKAGEHRAGIHVDDVVSFQELLGLAQGEPYVVSVLRQLDIVGDLDHDVAVALAQEAPALLGLKNIDEDLPVRGVLEIFKERRGIPFVDPSVVALGGLQGRAELDAADVAGFHLRLEQEMKYPVEFLRDEPEKADLWLVDDRLPPVRDRAEVRFHLDPLDREKPAARMPQIARRLQKRPATKI